MAKDKDVEILKVFSLIRAALAKKKKQAKKKAVQSSDKK